jgi:hypothetical protein
MIMNRTAMSWTMTSGSRPLRLLLAGALVMATATSVAAQSEVPRPAPGNPSSAEPKPGEIKPMPANPGASDLVINPTTAECERGWMSGMKWSQEEFAQMCAVMKSAK